MKRQRFEGTAETKRSATKRRTTTTRRRAERSPERRRRSGVEKKRRVFFLSGFGRIRDAPMIPAPMKPSLVGVGESAAMVTTERVERTGGREVGVDRRLGVGDVSGVP